MRVMKNKKKMLETLVVLMLFVCVSVGFGRAPTEEPANTAEPVLITLTWANHQAYPWNPEWPVTTYIEKTLNINLEAEAIPFQEYDTKLVALMAAGNTPDIMLAAGGDAYAEGYKANLLLPVNDYLDQMPNLSNLLDERGGLSAVLFAAGEMDGNMYRFPCFSSMQADNVSVWVREDVYKEEGLFYPQTAEEMADTLLKLKELFPDSVGFTNFYGANTLINMSYSMFNVPRSPFSRFFVDTSTDKWVCEAATENVKGMVQYWRDLYDAGCLDPEIPSQDNAVAKNKMLHGLSMLFHGWISAIDQFRAAVADENPDYSIIPIGFPPSERYGGYSSAEQPFNVGETPLVMKSTATQGNFPKMLEFMDFLYSDKGIEVANFGIEGESFVWTDDGLAKVIDETCVNPETGGPSADYASKWGTTVWPWKTVYSRKFFYGTSPAVLEFYAREQARTTMRSPKVMMTPEEQEDFSAIHQPLNDYIGTEYVRFVFGQRPMSEWSKFVSECRAKGMDQVTDWLNQYYERQKAMAAK